MQTATIIQITDPKGVILYAQNFTSHESYGDFLKIFGKSTEPSSQLKATLVPIRTQGIYDFIKDLFIPNTQHQSVSYKKFEAKTLMALSVDLVTLPIRLCTAPLKIALNHLAPEKEHPIAYLISNAILSEVTLRCIRNVYQDQRSIVTIREKRLFIKEHPKSPEKETLKVVLTNLTQQITVTKPVYASRLHI